jgi:glutathione synthase/RimK-type ligase-like ATP-grasp enzyme
MPSPRIALATASQMPVPDPESGLVVAALAELGAEAELVAWDLERDWSQYALVVSRTPWDYFHRHDEFVAWIRGVDAVTRIENPAETLIWNSHKAYLHELAAAGVPVIETAVLRRGAGAGEQAAVLERDGEVVVKPAVSGGGLETLRAPAGSGEARAHLAELVARKDVLVQPFAAEILASGETSLVYFDGELSHALRKRGAAGNFLIHAERGGSVEPHVPHREELAVAEAALAAAPGGARPAYARMDLVETEAGPALMEAELIEPELFLPQNPGSAERFAAVLLARAVHARARV